MYLSDCAVTPQKVESGKINGLNELNLHFFTQIVKFTKPKNTKND